MVDNSEFANDKENVSETVSSERVTDRRKLFRRLVALAGLGVTGALLSQKTGLIPPAEAQIPGTLWYTSSTVTNPNGTIEGDNTGNGAGVYGFSAYGNGVSGYATNTGQGVYGNSSSGIGGYFTTQSGPSALYVDGSATVTGGLHVGPGAQNTAGINATKSAPGGGLIKGNNTDTSANYDVGVYGQSNGPMGYGVWGYSNKTTTSTGGIGVLGTVEPVSAGTGFAGVMGLAITGTGVIGASETGTGGSFEGTPAIYADGNVGIGTKTPLNPLDVVGAVAIGTYAGVDAAPSGGLIVSGKVGIGTNTPSYPLDVEGIATTSAAAAGRVADFLLPNLESGNVTEIGIGKAYSTYQSLALGYFYSSTSADSYAYLGNVGDAVYGVGQGLIVRAGGNVGIGTTTPQTTLQVNGGVSVAVKTVTSAYTMTSSDFTILANAKSGAFNVTLPPASNSGMLVFIKKVDSSSHHVTIARTGTDTIEGLASVALQGTNQSRTLVAGGNGVWYVLSNAI